MLGRRSQPRRFDLVLLSQNEDYVSDYICVFCRGGSKGLRCSGRLKLCSQSLFIDPDSYEYPVYRFCFKDIEALEVIDIKVESRSEYVTDCLNSLSSTGCSSALVFHSKSLTEMKHFGQDTPYLTSALSGALVVTAIVLPYSNLNSEFPLIKRLWEFSLLSDPLQLETFLKQRTERAAFDRTIFKSVKERRLLDSAVFCMVVRPLEHSRSLVMITDAYLYIQPLVQDAGQSNSSKFVVSYSVGALRTVMKRRHHLRHIALEIFFKDGQTVVNSLFLSFASADDRDLIYSIIISHVDLDQPSLSAAVDSWVSGAMSNFDYLMALNRFAGRSYMDFTSYHVFPWILTDYTSTELNLDDPSVYRDLSKPVGALNPDRLEKFRQRFKEMPQDVPRFLYGTHYSAPGYVVYYLVRSHPKYMLSLQSGRFDTPDRLFISINETWQSCNNNQADVKELIPEFFDTAHHPDFLEECCSFLGHRADGTPVGKVVLPPWADNNPTKFISKMREALDSPYVSEHLHEWIDLIFGCKQRGDEAIAADNLFYHLTYEGAVDIESILDKNEQRSLLAQIQEFGQTPAMLFTLPHPRWNPVQSAIPASMPSLQALAYGGSYSSQTNQPEFGDAAEPTSESLHYLRNIKDGVSAWSQESFSFHSDKVSFALFDPANQNSIVSVSRDGSLKAFSLSDKRLIRSCYPGAPGLGLSCLCPATAIKQSAVLRFFICGSVDSKLHVFCSNAGQVVQNLAFAHEDTPTDCQWSPFHKQLASCALDAAIKIWDISSTGITPVPIHVYSEHEAPVLCLDWGESVLATGCSARNIAIWDPRTQSSSSFFFEVHNGPVTDLCWSSESQLVSCSSDCSLQITDIRFGKPLVQTQLPNALTCVKSIGPITAAGSIDGRIYLYDNTSLNYQQSLCTMPMTPIESLDISDDCSQVCASGQELTIWTQQSSNI